ncbi:uncharacterized protein GGS22DRAFT_197695 [Annulohypoxylon maeteangense]|uniref:uncharacterized protein n=1 Tax=Annulohypoxylon maeteangense TaxID=1927788 RepID=UPI0020076BDE|nr:uncharacterized protein GGS22DRAFT_197695 [Annulohypoxylon maeteangense]KAI0887700.1 hypothetical protein GGS22DRAFT_197695 [Annulohypoxylon maeteangense]
MGRPLFSFVLQLELFLTASASRFVLPPAITQPSDGAFADVQQPAPTAAPELYASMELLRRDGYNMGHDTCGFGSLDPGITYTCYSTDATCEDIGSYRGCCTGGLKACSSTFWTQCDDYNPKSNCGISAKTRCCQSALPYCITWLFSTSGSTVTAWDCDTQSNTRVFDMLATPLSLIDTTASATTNGSSASLTEGATTSPSTSSSPATSDPTAESSTSIADSSPSTNTSSSSNSSSGTPVGAIVGGVVGGVAVIALIILGIFFIKKYQRGASASVSQPPAPSGPQELPGSGTHSPYTPTQYDVTGQPKFELPMTEAPPVYEVPNTPAAGTELIESRKRKRFSTSTLSESPESHKFTFTNARPGKSTHPYDTGVGETVAIAVENNIRPRISSRRMEQATVRRDSLAQTTDRPPKSKRVKSTPSLFRDRTHGLTPRKRNGSNFTPESRNKGDSSPQHGITLRNILGLNKNRGNASDTNASETTSVSPPQASTESGTLIKSRRRKWWNINKQRSIRDFKRHQDITPGFIEPSSALDEDEEDDDLAALRKPQNTWKDVRIRHASRCQKKEIYQGTPKTTNYAYLSQPDRDSKTLEYKLHIGHRKSMSSSQARPSTTGTSSTPGTTTARRDFAQDDWRETPSPMTTNGILRFFLGPRRTPPSTTATHLDLPQGPKISVSISTPPPGLQSRESRGSCRPSAENKSRTWIPFRASPRPQPNSSLHESGQKSSRVRGQEERLEPIVGEPVPSRSPNLKKSWDRILRKRWRSG